MNYLLAFIIFGICFIGMAVGIIFAKRALRKSCSADPSNPGANCACKIQDASCSQQDDLLKMHPKIKPK
jgi:hypothetical protein